MELIGQGLIQEVHSWVQAIRNRQKVRPTVEIQTVQTIRPILVASPMQRLFVSW